MTARDVSRYTNQNYPDTMFEHCPEDEIPPGDKIYYAADDYDALQAQLADWKERALNAEARLQVYASRATQASGDSERG